jgi:hypothetical protein
MVAGAPLRDDEAKDKRFGLCSTRQQVVLQMRIRRLTSAIMMLSLVFGAFVCTEAAQSTPHAILASPRSPPETTSTTMAGDVMEVSGRVTRIEKKLPSGEPYPPDLQGAPAMFEITVRLQAADGSEAERIVAYMAYPPSPVGDAQRERVRLRFHEGAIKPGHHIKARGTFDPQTNTIRVGAEGDFIETFP